MSVELVYSFTFTQFWNLNSGQQAVLLGSEHLYLLRAISVAPVFPMHSVKSLFSTQTVSRQTGWLPPLLVISTTGWIHTLHDPAPFLLKLKLSYFSLLFSIGAARNTLIKPESWGQHMPGDTMTGSQNNRNKPLPFLSVLVSGWGTTIELVPNCPRREPFWKEETFHSRTPFPIPYPDPRGHREVWAGWQQWRL